MDDALQLLEGYGLTVLERYRSKKNRVYRVSDGRRELAAKLYTCAAACAREKSALLEAGARGIAVPRPLALLREDLLLLEKVTGTNLCDVLNQTLEATLARRLGTWLGELHARFRRGGCTLLKGDAVLRNFLVGAGGQLYGLDWEESREGEPLSEVGEACASVLSTDPMFTPAKYRLVTELLAAYEEAAQAGALPAVIPHVAAALRRFAGFRPRQAELLLAQAAELEVSGAGLLECEVQVRKTGPQLRAEVKERQHAGGAEQAQGDERAVPPGKRTLAQVGAPAVETEGTPFHGDGQGVHLLQRRHGERPEHVAGQLGQGGWGGAVQGDALGQLRSVHRTRLFPQQRDKAQRRHQHEAVAIRQPGLHKRVGQVARVGGGGKEVTCPRDVKQAQGHGEPAHQAADGYSELSRRQHHEGRAFLVKEELGAEKGEAEDQHEA
nr:hypothetical protein [Gelria sp. Kuro-4]